MNPDAYVGGDPVNAIDPLGLRALTDCEKSVLSKHFNSNVLNDADVHEGLPPFNLTNNNVWVPTGPGSGAHGGPHWDVQKPGGGYINVYPGGHTRGGG